LSSASSSLLPLPGSCVGLLFDLTCAAGCYVHLFGLVVVVCVCVCGTNFDDDGCIVVTIIIVGSCAFVILAFGLFSSAPFNAEVRAEMRSVHHSMSHTISWWRAARSTGCHHSWLLQSLVACTEFSTWFCTLLIVLWEVTIEEEGLDENPIQPSKTSMFSGVVGRVLGQ